jgi:uncharacterized protein YjbJ (UPF0337 family)
MKKIMLSLVAGMCLVGFSSLSFAEEMKGEMKEMKGEMKEKMGGMKEKMGEMKGDKTGEMKDDGMKDDGMKGKMKEKMGEMKEKMGEMKGKMGK